MARRCDGIYQRGRSWWWCLFIVAPLLWPPSVAEAQFNRDSWLQLYDSLPSQGKRVAIAYVSGMATGLTIAEAMDCTGVELSAEQLAATVAQIVRVRGLELNLAVPLALVAHKCRPTPNSVFERVPR